MGFKENEKSIDVVSESEFQLIFKKLLFVGCAKNQRTSTIV